MDFAGDIIKRASSKPGTATLGTPLVILAEHEVWGVENLGADGVTIRVAVKTLPGKQFPLACHLRAPVKAAFEEAGTEFPVPQHTVWHRTEGGEPPREGLEWKATTALPITPLNRGLVRKSPSSTSVTT